MEIIDQVIRELGLPSNLSRNEFLMLIDDDDRRRVDFLIKKLERITSYDNDDKILNNYSHIPGFIKVISKTTREFDHMAYKMLTTGWCDGVNDQEFGQYILAFSYLLSEVGVEQTISVPFTLNRFRPECVFFRFDCNVDLRNLTYPTARLLKALNWTRHKALVLSPFRYWLDDLWLRCWPFLCLYSLFAAAMIALFFVFTFYKNVTVLFVLVIICLAIETAWQLAGIIMDWWFFFTNFPNIISFVALVFGYIVTLWTRTRNIDEPNSPLRYFQIVSQYLYMLKAFQALRVFRPWTTIVTLLFWMVGSTFMMWFVYGYVVVALGAVWYRADHLDSATYGDGLTNLFFIIFDACSVVDVYSGAEWVIQVFACILAYLLFFDYILSRMAIKYKQLYKNRHYVVYQYKASQIYELEIRCRLIMILLGDPDTVGCGLQKYRREKSYSYMTMASNDVRDLLDYEKSVQQKIIVLEDKLGLWENQHDELMKKILKKINRTNQIQK